jgi:diguanylate cyclase (GGDEF)-like protein
MKQGNRRRGLGRASPAVGWVRSSWVTWGLPFGLAYALLMSVGRLLSFPEVGFATFWPPGALYFAGLVRLRPHRWPPLLAGALAASLTLSLLHQGPPVALTLVFWAGNSLEAMAAAWLLQNRHGTGFSLQTLREVLDFVLFAVILSPMLSATVGAGARAVAHGTPLWPSWSVWWAGDALGLLIGAPILLSWLGMDLPRLRHMRPARFAELLLALVLLTFTATRIFAEPSPGAPYLRFTYWVFPFLIWISARFDLRAASLAPLILALVAAARTTAGDGPFADAGGSAPQQAILLQIFLGVAALITLQLSVSSAERGRVQGSLAAKQRELEEANARLGTLAETDPLTTLKNRRAFERTLDREFAFATRTGIPLSLIVLDIDRFKKYKDQLGHPAGDEVLRIISSLLLRSVRQMDLVARYGGEEFIVILPGTDQAGASIMAERLRRSIELHPWPERPVTASLGLATYVPGEAEDCTTPDELFARADTALYYAKSTGRNRVVHASEMLGELREPETGTHTITT